MAAARQAPAQALCRGPDGSAGLSSEPAWARSERPWQHPDPAEPREQDGPCSIPGCLQGGVTGLLRKISGKHRSCMVQTLHKTMPIFPKWNFW